MVPPGAQPDLGDANPGHERTESKDSQTTLLNDGADSRPKYDRRSLARTTSDDEDDSVFAINNQRFQVTTGTPAGPTEATTTPSAGRPTAAAPLNVPIFTTAAQAVVGQPTNADDGPNEGPYDDDVDSAAQSDDGGSCTDGFSTTEDQAKDCDCDICRRTAAAAVHVAECEELPTRDAAPQHDSYDCCCCLGCCDCGNEPAEEDKVPVDAAPQPESCDCCCCRGCWCCVEHLWSTDEEEDVASYPGPQKYKWTVVGCVQLGTDLYADVIDESGVAWRLELVGDDDSDDDDDDDDSCDDDSCDDDSCDDDSCDDDHDDDNDHDDDDDSYDDDDDSDYDTDDVDECYLVVVTNSGGSHMTP